MYPASPWSLYSTSLVFTGSRTVRFFGNLKFGAGGEDGEDEAKPTLLEIGAAIVELDQKMQAAIGPGWDKGPSMGFHDASEQRCSLGEGKDAGHGGRGWRRQGGAGRAKFG